MEEIVRRDILLLIEMQADVKQDISSPHCENRTVSSLLIDGNFFFLFFFFHV